MRSLTSCVCAVAALACNETTAPAPLASGSASTAAASASVAKTADVRAPSEIEPVYPKQPGPAHPLADRFCAAVQGLPPKRRAACCEGVSGSSSLPEKECSRMLGFAAIDGTIAVVEAALAACEAALDKAHEGCGWVGLTPQQLPEQCLSVLSGSRNEGDACRSSLECSGNLRCHGLSATQKGRCASGRPAGAICGTGGDPLAAVARQNDVDREHPECAGHCKQSRCTDGAAQAVGATNAVPRKPAGEACAADAECLGGCEITKGSSSGRCIKRCRLDKPLDLGGRPSASAVR